MREFILRALKARTSPDFKLSEPKEAGGIDTVCRFISNTLWISNNLRRDTIAHVCMDGPKYPPKTISFSGKNLRDVEANERSIGNKIKLALKAGENLKLEESKEIWPGIIISKKSFESLVKEKSESSQLIYLHKKGKDIREIKTKNNICVVLGDFIGMPKKTESLLDRLNGTRVTLGPVMLFASHCPIIVHNELDRRKS